MMKKKDGGVRERIVASANRLFRAQGYDHTGINQVIEESQTAKASFYQYFPSKDDLGRAYLLSYQEAQISGMKLIMKRYPDPREFAGAWMRFVKREIRQGNLFGCPVGNFRAQIGSSRAFDEVICSMTDGVLETLRDYFEEARKSGHVARSSSPLKLARGMFAAYHGALQAWRLSGDISFLDEMAVLGNALLHHDG